VLACEGVCCGCVLWVCDVGVRGLGWVLVCTGAGVVCARWRVVLAGGAAGKERLRHKMAQAGGASAATPRPRAEGAHERGPTRKPGGSGNQVSTRRTISAVL
jgi:hypothetical protein